MLAYIDIKRLRISVHLFGQRKRERGGGGEKGSKGKYSQFSLVNPPPRKRKPWRASNTNRTRLECYLQESLYELRESPV